MSDPVSSPEIISDFDSEKTTWLTESFNNAAQTAMKNFNEITGASEKPHGIELCFKMIRFSKSHKEESFLSEVVYEFTAAYLYTEDFVWKKIPVYRGNMGLQPLDRYTEKDLPQVFIQGALNTLIWVYQRFVPEDVQVQ